MWNILPEKLARKDRQSEINRVRGTKSRSFLIRNSCPFQDDFASYFLCFETTQNHKKKRPRSIRKEARKLEMSFSEHIS